jgi:SWI/SNF-related matrix-associated actin-dependent regulator of chromatin subfamily A3
VDRVHRLGQTRACKVVRLIVEDTIEDQVLEVQAKKRKLAGLAFGEKGRNRTQERAEHYRDLERLIQ